MKLNVTYEKPFCEILLCTHFEGVVNDNSKQTMMP